MSAYFNYISTQVPDHAYDQQEVRETMKKLVGKTERQKKLIHQIYARSGIQTRHSIFDEFNTAGNPNIYSDGEATSTGARNDIYKKESRKLFIKTARDLLVNTPEASPDSITHLITISCTGFYAPGPDFDIIKELGLSRHVERYHLGFMGCYAALSGLKLAAQICRSDKQAAVMVVANELCTLHFQGGSETDELISSSVFSDGAAGTIVTGNKPEKSPGIEAGKFISTLTDEGKADMSWTIGDTGFDMVLSSKIPDLLSENMEPFLRPMFSKFGIEADQVDHWAVHPGGRSILDRFERLLNLPDDALNHSRNVLSDNGNMSSATILFVLKEILEATSLKQGRENVLTLAFGPGLTVESGLFMKY